MYKKLKSKNFVNNATSRYKDIKMSVAIQEMFSSISNDYDKMNNIISFGFHKNWKLKLVKLAKPKAGDRILDLACGTGDICFEFAKITKNNATIIGMDFSQNMLDEAVKKNTNFSSEVKFTNGDAMNTGFADNSFDVVSCGYGIRNFDDTILAIEEMARICKPGGRIAILETGKPSGILKFFFDLYNNNIVPKLGKIIAKNESAYTYLPESVTHFPYSKDFARLLQSNHKINKVYFKKLLFGASFIYIAEVG